MNQHDCRLQVVATHVLAALIPGDLRLVTRSTISDTKGDTITLLVTVLLPRTETVVDVWKIPGVLLYSINWGIFHTCASSLYQATFSWPGCEANLTANRTSYCIKSNTVKLVYLTCL